LRCACRDPCVKYTDRGSRRAAISRSARERTRTRGEGMGASGGPHNLGSGAPSIGSDSDMRAPAEANGTPWHEAQ
jgi:hypothetical protein